MNIIKPLLILDVISNFLILNWTCTLMYHMTSDHIDMNKYKINKIRAKNLLSLFSLTRVQILTFLNTGALSLVSEIIIDVGTWTTLFGTVLSSLTTTSSNVTKNLRVSLTWYSKWLIVSGNKQQTLTTILQVDNWELYI